MSQACSQFAEFVDLYAIGALDGAERDVFERHLLSGCAACRSAVNEAESTLSLIALVAPPATPSPRVRSRLLAAVAGKRGAFPTWLAVAAALLAIAAIAAGFVAWQRATLARTAERALADSHESTERLDRELASAKQRETALAAELEAARRELAAANDRANSLGTRAQQLAADLAAANAQLKRVQDEASGLLTRADGAESELRARRDELDFLARSTTRRIEMTTEPGKGARVATAFVDAASGRAVIRSTVMPPLSTGRVYQLWFVNQADQPVSGGTFSAEAVARGVSQQGPASLKSGVVLAITVEPEGGSPAPTTTPFAYGPLAAK